METTQFTYLSAYSLSRFLLGLPLGVISLDFAWSLNSLSLSLSVFASTDSDPSLSRLWSVSLLECDRLLVAPIEDPAVWAGDKRGGL
jgi:hypothetical protein